MLTVFTDQELLKLPKWAREKALIQEELIEKLFDEVRIVEADKDDEIYWCLAQSDSTNIAVPHRSYVMVNLPSGTIECTVRNGRLIVKSDSSDLIITPRYTGLEIQVK